MDPKEFLKSYLNDFSNLVKPNKVVVHKLVEVADLLKSTYDQGKKALIFGNGGSAADAQHLVGELVGRFYLERAPLPAIALTVNTSNLTAIGNDYSYNEVFSRQLRALGHEGDVAIGISTSGSSASIVNAMKIAKSSGLITIGLTGGKDSLVGDQSDLIIQIPSEDTPRIQEGHITAIHIICELVERSFAELDNAGPTL